MKISYQWLKSLIDLDGPPEQIADQLTEVGLEVSHITPFRFIPPNLVLGKIIESVPHPNADKLKKVKVDIGQEQLLSIVCGAPNALAGAMVIVAPVGSVLTLPNNKVLKIKKAKIKGEVSEGMLCAEDEIGLGDHHDKIITLRTDSPCGTSLEDLWGTPPDYVFEIDLTPNRNDATSHYGVARDLSALLNKAVRKPIVQPQIPTNSVPIHIVVKDKKACPRYTGVVIKNIKLAPSSIWMQSRLKSIGIRPCNNVVDITNFLMHDVGQPLHAFDYDKVQKRKIAIKKMPPGTPFLALDGVEYILNGEELMVCDAEGPIAMAGIIGGERTKVTEDTQHIFLESAYFDPTAITRAARYHHLHTDASFRFARGTDPNATYLILQKAAYMMQKYARGEIQSMLEDHHFIKDTPMSIPITYAYITRIVGEEIPVPMIHQILTRMDILVQKPTSEGFVAAVPPYKRDVVRPIDVVEEILRIYGYNKIEITPQPKVQLNYTPLFNYARAEQHNIKKLLAAKGYHEIVTNALVEAAEEEEDAKAIYIANPVNKAHNRLRNTLLESGLGTIAYNLHHKQQVISLFEVGKNYCQNEGKFKEVEKLGIWLAGLKYLPNWAYKAETNSFLDLYATVQHLFAYKQLPIPNLVEKAHPAYIFYGTLEDEKHSYGYLGEVSPAYLAKFGVRTPVFFAELDLHALLARPKEGRKAYQPFSKFPDAMRDLSLAIDEQVTFGQVEAIIEEVKKSRKQSKGPVIAGMSLVDCYQGPSLAATEKSYTIRLQLQSDKETLKEKDIQQVMQQVAITLTNRLNATIRE